MSLPARRVLGAAEAADLPPGSRLEVEIGCGNGHFLAAYGQRVSATLLGVDIKAKRCAKAISKVERLGLDHVHIVCGRAEELVEALRPGAVDAFHVYFPDPWPKSRHQRRRLLRNPQLQMLRTRLRDGGSLYFVTDFLDYYVQTKVLLLLHPGFEVAAEPPPQEALESLFGRRFTEWGKNIHYVTGRAVSTGPGC